METIYTELDLRPAIETIHSRTIDFLKKIANRPASNLQRKLVCCQAEPNGSIPKGRKPKSTRETYMHVLKENKTLEKTDRAGAFSTWSGIV